MVTLTGGFTVETGKTYDGTTAATITGDTLGLSGVLGGDTVSLDALATYADKNAGTGKTVTLATSMLTGTDGANYAISFSGAPTATADILPRLLTVTADDKTRPQGQANPPFTASYANFASGDTPAVLGGVLTFMTPADVSSAAGRYPIALSGLTSSNYAFRYVDGMLTVIRFPDLDQRAAIGWDAARTNLQNDTLSAGRRRSNVAWHMCVEGAVTLLCPTRLTSGADDDNRTPLRLPPEAGTGVPRLIEVQKYGTP
jgi:hypothetical protein